MLTYIFELARVKCPVDGHPWSATVTVVMDYKKGPPAEFYGLAQQATDLAKATPRFFWDYADALWTLLDPQVALVSIRIETFIPSLTEGGGTRPFKGTGVIELS